MGKRDTENRGDNGQAPVTGGPVISIRGARVHNLRNVDLDVPRDRLVVITGPSGSGKSSLAFDTLYAEGQRQYIESLSVYARQFFDQIERPDVDLIDGLQPTIAIDQRAGIHNPRSTVATVTEIYDYLRLLYARLGQPYCYRCGEPIAQQTPEEIIDELLALPAGTKVILMAPLVRGRKGKHQDVLDQVRKAGFVRVRVDRVVYDLDNVPELAPRKNHTIEAVVDRVIIRAKIHARLAESIRLAVRHGEGSVAVAYLDAAAKDTRGPWHDQSFSTEYACPGCRISYEELEPRTFSFNSPYGACPECEGLGERIEFDPELVVPDWSLSLSGGAIAPWKALNAAAQRRQEQALGWFLQQAGFDVSCPLSELKPRARERLLHGDGKRFAGLLGLLEIEYAATKSRKVIERLDAFRGKISCPACQGARLRAEARAVRIGEKAIHELTALPVADAQDYVRGCRFADDDLPIAKPLVTEICGRLGFLRKVGLDYLTLDRAADTLSGGELQRIRLATGIGSGLVGVCYVLDEPSIGLHQRDNDRLIEALIELKQQGNSVLVVEHDEAIMRRADYLIDLGPGAGQHGGRVVSQGTPTAVSADERSVTGQYLAGQQSIAVPIRRRKIVLKRAIEIDGATVNNLKNVSARFPLAVFVCVTGVSGSGKSSLLNETLAKALVRRLEGAGPKPGPHTSLRGVRQISKLVHVDQSPIGRTPRSNPATYTGVFDEVRKVFTSTRASRLRGYKPGRFSFNVKGGRCEECQGQGMQRVEMNFLPDLYVLCAACNGARFNRQTLEVKYRGRSIADVLGMRIDEALAFFENFPAMVRLLNCLVDVGLGYLTLGQPSTTLSGGEAQRIKLATELARGGSGNTLYILDEPTTGLHFQDIQNLLLVLGRLVDAGNTVIVIEHNLDVAKSADWIIDLGPEGGQQGGHIVAAGTPEQIAAQTDNHTGRYLRPLLASGGND